MIENTNIRNKTAGHLSKDESGRQSDGTVFRASNLLTPISVGTSSVVVPAEWFRTSIILYNASAVSTDRIYVGDDTVTTANGIPILPGWTFPIFISKQLDIHVISNNAAGVELRAWELG